MHAQQSVKNLILTFEKNFFFKNCDFQKSCKDEIDDTQEKICSRITARIFTKIDFSA